MLVIPLQTILLFLNPEQNERGACSHSNDTLYFLQVTICARFSSNLFLFKSDSYSHFLQKMDATWPFSKAVTLCGTGSGGAWHQARFNDRIAVRRGGWREDNTDDDDDDDVISILKYKWQFPDCLYKRELPFTGNKWLLSILSDNNFYVKKRFGLYLISLAINRRLFYIPPPAALPGSARLRLPCPKIHPPPVLAPSLKQRVLGQSIRMKGHPEVI